MASPDDIDEFGDTPRPLVVRVKLTSVQDVQKELSKLYRLARAKKLDTSEASKLANILMLIARIMETSELEERIARLEGQSTASYGHADLLNVAKSAERAENWIARQANAAK